MRYIDKKIKLTIKTTDATHKAIQNMYLRCGLVSASEFVRVAINEFVKYPTVATCELVVEPKPCHVGTVITLGVWGKICTIANCRGVEPVDVVRAAIIRKIERVKRKGERDDDD